MKKTLILFIVLIFASFSVFADALSKEESALLEHIRKTMVSRGFNPVVSLEKIKPVDKTGFYIYALTIADAEKNISNRQYLLFNGKYMVEDFIDPIEGSGVIQDYLYEASNIAADYKKFSLLSGKPDAKNFVIEITNFECPYCRNAFIYINDLTKKRDDVAVYIAHMASRDRALLYAQIFEAGLLQNNNFAEDIFTNKNLNSMSNDQIIDYFAKKTAKPEQFKSDVKSSEVNKTVDLGMQLADDLQLSATPVIIINGKMIQGFDKTNIDKAFEQM